MANSNTRAVPLRRPRSARPRRDYWRGLIEKCGRSGLRQAEFCRRRGIAPGTLSCWKHKLSHEARPAFLPVRVVSARPPSVDATAGGPTDGGGEIEIVLARGGLVRVRGRVDATWLGEVLQTLATTRC